MAGLLAATENGESDRTYCGQAHRRWLRGYDNALVNRNGFAWENIGVPQVARRGVRRDCAEQCQLLKS